MASSQRLNAKASKKYYLFYRCFKHNNTNLSVIRLHDQVDQMLNLLSFTKPQVDYMLEFIQKKMEQALEKRTKQLYSKKKALMEVLKKLEKLEQRMINGKIEHSFGKTIAGRIELVNSEINPDIRISLIRIAVENKENLLKPGMNPYVTLDTRASSALTIPWNVVFRNQRYNTVWMKSGQNTYKLVHATLGKEDGELEEDLSGLHSDDIVVTSGAKLINSEYIFRNGTGKEHDIRHM